MADTKENLIKRLQTIRKKTVEICSHIENEDYIVQPAPEVSPPKWHLAHTSWFFEELILSKSKKDYTPFNAEFRILFNSYYKAVGAHTIQAGRGNLSRPTVSEVMQYRTHIDDQLKELLTQCDITGELLSLIETGIHHEQQHQELLYMDIKAILASNQLPTAYVSTQLKDAPPPAQGWTNFEEGLVEIGYDGDDFSYDNERPPHKNYLYPFAISQSLVTNGDFLAFIQDNGYAQAKCWLSQGWDWVNQERIRHPLYWIQSAEGWSEYTLHGLVPLDLNKPLVHISYFEAAAFANWKNLRLPTEQELEVFLAASTTDEYENDYHPNNAQAASGQVWCWTASQYSPYPRFKAFDGLLNEYNSKFMCNQFVLKGGCVVTPKHHYRHSYRNFYHPEQRWMFSGIRLAKDIA
ncbi:MAG: ergothioneine biosynthesis protein EgtB [Methylophilaceae bacterium]